MKLNFVAQENQMDCGPACLSMITSYFGRQYSMQYLRDECYITRAGVSLLGIKVAAEKIGFTCTAAKADLDSLANMNVPCILYWEQNHFVILIKRNRKKSKNGYTYKIADPAYGIYNVSEERLLKSWTGSTDLGVLMLLEPTSKFYSASSTISAVKTPNILSLLKYLTPHKKSMSWIAFFLLLESLVALVFPLLTQKLIDEGVELKNLSIISYILLAQLAFFLGGIVSNILRTWLMLIVGTKVSLQIISDFLKKIIQLPLKVFDSKLKGDFQQRIRDQERIERFLTSQSLLTLFSLITFSIFFFVLYLYDWRIMLLYIILTIVSVIWSFYWIEKRKVLDYFAFRYRSESIDAIHEIIEGVSEMKLNQFEELKHEEWKKLQMKLYESNRKLLKLNQFQIAGHQFINQLKNILVTFLSAYFVVNGNMTIGGLLSVSYIIGQMNSPINQLIEFIRSFQEAKLSISRLEEINDIHGEELDSDREIPEPQENNQIFLNNVSFQYGAPSSPFVLKNISLEIPNGKVLAIVGASGSGKTTLLKLLLKFYSPTKGEIYYNGGNLNEISAKSLRTQSGVVMQDGFIFSDTIERNIVTGHDAPDITKLRQAISTANIDKFIDELPLNFRTKIGAGGNGISGGQKQRILIARAVYKNPRYFFLDEATSALDSENEKIIHENLRAFYKGKTVVIVAHRLSTVRNADKIIVLKNGSIIEEGSHSELVNKRCEYFSLIRNQLELGG